MKADTTRSTFKQARHYNRVLMQQGRVQIDADWNEQIDITGHRIETEAIDVVGRCGAPMHDAGFHIVSKATDLKDPEEKNLPENQNPPVPAAGDLLISGGRYYVDGILCQNDKITTYTKQPDLPDTPVITQAGTYLAYLDVWFRHITAIEDPAIREVALGGPDTCTRSKTIWQVKLFRVGDINVPADCSTIFNSWNEAIAAGTGKLAARTATSAPSNDPCIVAPGAGYRRLENQHYRVEVHDKGSLGTATFKWSRDNGSIVTKWESQNVNDLTVSNPGRDKVLNFASGQWVELLDDTSELLGNPGTLVQLAKVEGNVLTINAATATGTTDITKFPRNPRVRRWDMAALLKPGNQGWIDLEDGVQVHFTTGTYKTGDYWLIPARTATADVEWPLDPATNDPLTQLPFGIVHHYCRLAVAKKDGANWTITDCRNIFPPLTELIDFQYVGGDGQEAMPDLTQPAQLTLLAQPLEAGVTNGEWPVAGAAIRFTVLKGDGRLQGNVTQVTVLTGANGVATCTWSIDSTLQSQQVEALLLDDGGNPICLPIHYSANPSVASQVAYNPAKCPGLKADKVTNVQDAIDHLCEVHQGGCCDVTVGKGGQFERLDEAIEKLLGEGKIDICICLIPGSDENLTLPKGLVIKAPSAGKVPVHVTISGCGLATRILVGEKPLIVGPLASFTLRNVALATQASGSLIQCGGVDEVVIENCHLYSYSSALGIRPSLLTIERANFIRVSDNFMSSLFEGPDTFKLLKVPRPILFGSDPLVAIAEEIAAALIKAKPDVRQEFVKPYQEFAGAGSTIPTTERRIMQQAIKIILEFGQQTTDGPVALGEFVRALYYGNALVLMDAIADTLIENNRITGRLLLYGNSDFLPQDEWKVFARRIQKGATKLTGARATLQIKNNLLTGISLDRSVAQPPTKEDLQGMHSRLLMAENLCYSNIQLVAGSLNLSSNQFNALYEFPFEVGTLAARSVVIVGNSAPNPASQLFFAVPSPAVTPSIPPFQLAANFLDVRPLP